MAYIAPKVALAPMAGITDAPLRAVVARFGADLVISEMIATHVHIAKPAQAQLRLGALGSIAGQGAVQLAGRDPGIMGRAAAQLAAEGVTHIDINMGCPAKKVTGGAAGAALMCDLPLAERIIAAVREAFDGALSVKMRLGWDAASLNAPQLAHIAQEEGVQMITVHGRTRAQFYKGRADWRAIRAVVEAVEIPVLANGDIQDISAAQQALAQSGAQGVMLGRGALGRPWLLSQIRAALTGTQMPAAPEPDAFCALVLGHYRAILEHYPAELGPRLGRKHLGWYMDVAQADKGLRRKLLTSTDPEFVVANLPCALHSYDPAEVQAVAA